MATEPVARGRVVSGEDVYDGYALERRCVGEDDEDCNRFVLKMDSFHSSASLFGAVTFVVFYETAHL